MSFVRSRVEEAHGIVIAKHSLRRSPYPHQPYVDWYIVVSRSADIVQAPSPYMQQQKNARAITKDKYDVTNNA